MRASGTIVVIVTAAIVVILAETEEGREAKNRSSWYLFGPA